MRRSKSYSQQCPYQVTTQGRSRAEAKEKVVLNVLVFRYLLTYFATTKNKSTVKLTIDLKMVFLF